MRLVLDSSVAIKWVLPEKDTPKAVRLRNEFRRGAHQLFAPDVFPVEVSHALTRAERRGVIRPPAAIKRLSNVLSYPPVLYPYLPLLVRAVGISSQTRQGVYDYLYVALAEREGCELLTADAKLITNLQPTFPFITPLSSLP
jgi:predicted nucleic acid-binding protein